MMETEFILEHEILKTLLVRNGGHFGDSYQIGDKIVPIHKRDFSDYKLHFGTLVDILNNPDKYPKDMITLRETVVFEKDVKTDKFSWGQVNNAIERLLLSEQVEDYINPYQKERTITLTRKGAADYWNNYYPEKKEKKLLDTKIKKLTLSNITFTRIVAIISLLIALISTLFSFYKFNNEQTQQTKLQKVQDTMNAVIQEQQSLRQYFERELPNYLQLKDTSINKVKSIE